MVMVTKHLWLNYNKDTYLLIPHQCVLECSPNVGFLGIAWSPGPQLQSYEYSMQYLNLRNDHTLSIFHKYLNLTENIIPIYWRNVNLSKQVISILVVLDGVIPDADFSGDSPLDIMDNLYELKQFQINVFQNIHRIFRTYFSKEFFTWIFLMNIPIKWKELTVTTFQSIPVFLEEAMYIDRVR